MKRNRKEGQKTSHPGEIKGKEDQDGPENELLVAGVPDEAITNRQKLL